MRSPGRFVVLFLFCLACLAPVAPSMAETLDADSRAALIAEIKANPADLEKWESGSQQLILSCMKERNYLSRMAQSRALIELIAQRLSLDEGKPLSDPAKVILLQAASVIQSGVFVLYEENEALQQWRNDIYTQIMKLPDCDSMECAYIQAWISALQATLTTNESERVRMFDFAYDRYGRVGQLLPEKDGATEQVMLHNLYIYTLSADAILSNSPQRRALLFSRADQHAQQAQKYQPQGERLSEILPELINRALLQLNMVKAYCAKSSVKREAYLAAADKNMAALTRLNDEAFRYFFQAEKAVIRGDWKNAMKNLHLVPVEFRPYLLTVPCIRNAKNPMVVAYKNEIRQTINRQAGSVR